MGGGETKEGSRAKVLTRPTTGTPRITLSVSKLQHSYICNVRTSVRITPTSVRMYMCS